MAQMLEDGEKQKAWLEAEAEKLRKEREEAKEEARKERKKLEEERREFEKEKEKSRREKEQEKRWEERERKRKEREYRERKEREEKDRKVKEKREKEAAAKRAEAAKEAAAKKAEAARKADAAKRAVAPKRSSTADSKTLEPRRSFKGDIADKGRESAIGWKGRPAHESSDEEEEEKSRNYQFEGRRLPPSMMAMTKKSDTLKRKARNMDLAVCHEMSARKYKSRLRNDGDLEVANTYSIVRGKTPKSNIQLFE